MKILSVKGENLLSMGEFELNFDDSGLVLVEGWNYDDGRANGAGKTAIFNLLCLAIYQKIPRKITMSEVLKRGHKKGYVEATVFANNDTYTLLYGRPKKRVVKKNGIEITISQEELESILKLSYEQFIASMYTIQGGGNRFLNKNDTEKKQFLLQLMNLDKFIECRKEAQHNCKELESEISEVNIKLERAHSKIDVYKESKVDISSIDSEIESLNKEINKLNEDIIENQKVDKPDLSKFYQLEDQIKDKYEQFAILKSQRRSLVIQYSSLNSSIVDFNPSDPDAYCPHCEIGLSVKNNTIAEHKDQDALRQQHEKHMDKLKIDLKKVKIDIDDIDSKLNEENKIKNLEIKIREKKEKDSAMYNRAQMYIQDCRNSVQTKKNEILSLQHQKDKNNEIEGKISALQELIGKLNVTLKDKQKKLEILREIASMYSPTGAPAYVMDSIVESFNEAVNEYTDLIWPSASYKLKSYKENKSGDMKAKFSESLIINGRPTSIGALSGGEQRAFSLSIDFAVADILSRHFGIPLNPIIMDEPFEGLDATGREVVIELLEKLAIDRQIWVIDHASEAKSMFSQILRVEKRNNTSIIVS